MNGEADDDNEPDTPVWPTHKTQTIGVALREQMNERDTVLPEHEALNAEHLGAPTSDQVAMVLGESPEARNVLRRFAKPDELRDPEQLETAIEKWNDYADGNDALEEWGENLPWCGGYSVEYIAWAMDLFERSDCEHVCFKAGSEVPLLLEAWKIDEGRSRYGNRSRTLHWRVFIAPRISDEGGARP